MHGVEVAMEKASADWKKSYYLPTPSDAGVAAFSEVDERTRGRRALGRRRGGREQGEAAGAAVGALQPPHQALQVLQRRWRSSARSRRSWWISPTPCARGGSSWASEAPLSGRSARRRRAVRRGTPPRAHERVRDMQANSSPPSSAEATPSPSSGDDAPSSRPSIRGRRKRSARVAYVGARVKRYVDSPRTNTFPIRTTRAMDSNDSPAAIASARSRGNLAPSPYMRGLGVVRVGRRPSPSPAPKPGSGTKGSGSGPIFQPHPIFTPPPAFSPHPILAYASSRGFLAGPPLPMGFLPPDPIPPPTPSPSPTPPSPPPPSP